jgi:hypothetical protein
VANTVFDTTVKHVAVKNTAYERDDALRAERLAVFNIQGAWQALPAMQAAFRRWFHQYLSPTTLTELERHEQSAFGHLWPAALAFINNPATTVRGGVGRIAAEMRETRRCFIRAASSELAAAMGDAGIATIVEGPVTLGGKRCIGVICDHQSAMTIEAAKRRVVLGLRDAARFREFGPFESVDIVMQWPHVFVCHTVRGGAILPAGAFISTAVLADAAEFEVAGHHIADVPVPADELAKGVSVRSWDIPLVSAAVQLHGSLAGFMFAMMQGAAMATEMLRHRLSASSTALSRRTLSQAIAEERRRALMSHQELAALLGPRRHDGPEHEAFVRAEEELSSIVSRLTYGDRTGVVELGLEEFEDWMERATCGGEALNAAIARLVDAALAAHSRA